MIYAIDKQITNALPFLDKKEKEHIWGFIQSSLNQKEQTQRISKEQYNREIDAAMARIDVGEYYTQNEVDIIMQQWKEKVV
jgi:hypothetical protein